MKQDFLCRCFPLQLAAIAPSLGRDHGSWARRTPASTFPSHCSSSWGCGQARPGGEVRHLLVGWGKLGSNGTQRALFLHASPIPIRPVRARCRLGASCERVVVRAERHIPACTLGQRCSPASTLKTHQRKPAGERTRWPRKPPGQPPLPGLLVLLTHGVPREDPRRAHVVRGPQKDTRQLLSALPAPRQPFNASGVSTCARLLPPTVNHRIQRLCTG